MRYTAEHKKRTQAKVIAAAGQIFRKEGYGGAGIDALTKAAGVTNGAFYGHFRSKSEAFRIAVLTGLEELRLGISALKAEHQQGWLKSFVTYYLGYKRTCDLGESCALPSLSADVMRTDNETRDAYTEELQRLIAEIAAGLPEGAPGDREGPSREDRAILLLALLTGGVTLARAVSDPALSEKIAGLVTTEALRRGRPEA
ncbi:TetR/AcrR family transcriptional regulator [Rhizobium binae]|uniref:AcrR family transcriptional regulator n=1 Tax=Rhizobium binae TaxID=1138190 RepID=A0ABV2MP56_9HYPH|nr:TetR/AcrR family transcriptional regulator [Rhizobium binae]NKL52351.1 TetR family transcriptional regulator [Rhizobium leguminosarum bv. viciae]MBX4924513.1 TetR/AcrR family transcriptional regulator [Rhizobium binae]MBX4940691.1 TetR/AcrR family transcriptional regulator [Rhizobium binae]MBX4947220.1 TetR/AcrR family transcriptional regulator [Rhizobium binae]MBX4949345.1 TetR/AcrR family transcriptional regulator [Rhizobium binae]